MAHRRPMERGGPFLASPEKFFTRFDPLLTGFFSHEIINLIDIGQHMMTRPRPDLGRTCSTEPKEKTL